MEEIFEIRSCVEVLANDIKIYTIYQYVLQLIATLAVIAIQSLCILRISALYSMIKFTRSQAVARIADRTASQHLRESRDVIGHVTIR